MQCPACPTETLVMTDRQGIEIDYCPECRGIWLDRGELDRLIEHADRIGRSAQPPQAPSPHGRPYPPSHHPRDEYRHGKRRHKSLLGELFDF